MIHLPITLTPELLALLDDMAREAGMPRNDLASSILKHVLEDDAEAHGEG